MASAPAIEVRNLRVIRGGTLALRNLSLTVDPGTVTGLLGPSASGKTTLMRAIVGVQRVAGGTVVVLGEEAGHPSLRRRVGYVTQAPSIYGDLTVRENLRYFARILRASGERIEAVVATVGLDPLLRRDLWATFHRLADAGTTLLVSSHVMGEAALCDRLLLLREGELLAAETPDELLERTRSDSLDDAFLRLVEEREAA
ncbi:MAG TPA: ATP-binding cassette domain-containing protein [Gaiellaceae bacterium]|nr:ATP-binding cassette domain-containing protein [Gaiellaceae bacterium]